MMNILFFLQSLLVKFSFGASIFRTATYKMGSNSLDNVQQYELGIFGSESITECFARCILRSTCRSFAFNGNNFQCQMLNSFITASSESGDWLFFSIQVCDDNWIDDGNSCYFFEDNERKNWQDSKTECDAMGTGLVQIDSQQEQDFLKNTAIAKGINRFWTSGSYISNTWKWEHSGQDIPLDGDPGFSEWSPTQPDSVGAQGCIMVRDDHNWKWDDHYCTQVVYYICERNY